MIKKIDITKNKSCVNITIFYLKIRALNILNTNQFMRKSVSHAPMNMARMTFLEINEIKNYLYTPFAFIYFIR